MTEKPNLTFERNPFALGVAPVVEPPKVAPTENPLPKLIGILWASQKQPIAIFIDHRQQTLRASEGDLIAEAKVIKIDLQNVVLMCGDERHELTMWKQNTGLSVR